MRYLILSLLCLGLVAQSLPPAQAPASPSAATPSGQAPTLAPTLALRAQRAQRLSTDALLQLQGELALAEDPGKTYAELLVAYTLVTHLRGKDPKGAEKLLDATTASLKPLKDPESLALHGACLGLKIGFSPMSGITLSPRAMGLFETAEAQAPKSPRVLLLKGVHLLHTPAFFGGGAKAALPVMEAAVKAAQEEAAPANAWAPSWGKAESLAWLALVEADLGKKAEAKAHLDQALALDPSYGFARAVVAPKVAQ